MKKATKFTKIKCNWCSKSSPNVQWYIIADDMEKPSPYHTKCYSKFIQHVMIKLAELDLEDSKNDPT